MSARATPQATMGVVEFKQYLGQLYRLDKDQVSKLLLHLRSLNHLTVAATSAPIGDHPSDDWLLPGLVDVMKRKGIMSKVSLPALKRSKAYARYLKSW